MDRQDTTRPQGVQVDAVGHRDHHVTTSSPLASPDVLASADAPLASALFTMMRRLLVLAVMPAACLVLMAPVAAAGNSLGPPGGTIYAFDVAYRTIATPTSLPANDPTDTIYVFPDCASCASVSEAAPGSPGYNGGRWRVVQAWGITTQLTNADDVVAAASALTDTGIRFVCPLLRA